MREEFEQKRNQWLVFKEVEQVEKMNKQMDKFSKTVVNKSDNQNDIIRSVVKLKMYSIQSKIKKAKSKITSRC